MNPKEEKRKSPQKEKVPKARKKKKPFFNTKWAQLDLDFYDPELG